MYEAHEHDDLPNDVLAELSKGAVNGMPTAESRKILQIICDCGGSATLDQIIIGLYTAHKIKTTRPRLSSRLSYMRGIGQLEPVKTQGIFTLSKLSIEYLGKTRKVSRSTPKPAVTDDRKENKPEAKNPSTKEASEPANANKPRTITCSFCETVKTFPPGKIVFKFEGEEFCTPECIKDFRESKL